MPVQSHSSQSIIKGQGDTWLTKPRIRTQRSSVNPVCLVFSEPAPWVFLVYLNFSPCKLLQAFAFCLRLGGRLCDSRRLSVCLRTKWLKKKNLNRFCGIVDDGLRNRWLPFGEFLDSVHYNTGESRNMCEMCCLVEVCALSDFPFFFLFHAWSYTPGCSESRTYWLCFVRIL